MIVKGVAAGSDRVRVTLRFPADIWAESVCVAGDFGRAHPQALQLTRTSRDPSGRSPSNWSGAGSPSSAT